MVAFVLADAFLDKFGGDSIGDVERAHDGWREALTSRFRGAMIRPIVRLGAPTPTVPPNRCRRSTTKSVHSWTICSHDVRRAGHRPRGTRSACRFACSSSMFRLAGSPVN